jgi:hypothetical protein
VTDAARWHTPLSAAAGRKQARRLFGSMGALMRKSSRLTAGRRASDADRLMIVRFHARAWRGN